ncbi:MAG TPA: hypothetical protein VH020_09935 [Stellaceae bacterium]|jgi:hypothetical protein|nr:hypothetical protein [Stellaceae bacterium]
MFFRLFFLATLVAGSIAARPAGAEIVGNASVPYSATRIVTVNGKSYTGKVFHSPGEQRHDVDINGIPLSFILDLADDRGVVILPALVSYIEFPLPPLLSELDRRRLDRKAVGEETIDGVRATKYRIDYVATDGTRGDGFLWLSRDNILLRIEGRIERRGHRKPMVVSMRLSDLRVGPQDHNLFKVPRGLRKIPAEALELLLNMRGHKSH